MALLLLAVHLFFGQGLVAAVITVDGFDSSTAEDGKCTLREAILAANGDTPTGGCAGGSGADTIVLTGDVTLTLEDSFDTATPRVTSRITLRGNGHEITRDATAAELRIFWVATIGDLTLRNTTVTNGGGPTFSSSLVDRDGAGILNQGTLRLIGSNLSGNTALPLGHGGGVSSRPGSTLEVIDCAFSGNHARWGGGIDSEGDTAITNSTFVLNTAVVMGGAIYSTFAEVTLTGSAVWANGALVGGGIRNYGGSLEVINSTISENIAWGDATFSPHGGGLLNEGTATLVNSTLAGNSAIGSSGGGAISTTGPVTLTNSLLADSPGFNCLAFHGGTITNGGNSLADDTTCGTVPGTFDATKFDTTMSDNGGGTRTHALLSGSNAVDAGGDCGLLTDQRGALRDGACDLGAYEYGADDRYETSGSGGSDDSCMGHQVQLGRYESHLHTRDISDWVWFQPLQGSTYEIETAGLVGGSDTVVQLWRGCSPPMLAEDDDGGPDLASKITYTATAADAASGLDVLIRDYNGTGVDRGYQVTVNCLAGACLSCAAGGGPELALSHERIVGHREIEACDRIHALDTVVEPGATAILRSGGSVGVGNGFVVRLGATLSVEIDPDLRQAP